MSDSSEFSSSKDSSRSGGSSFPKSSRKSGNSPLAVIDQCLASLPEGDHRIPLLYQLRHGLVEQTTASQQQEADMKKLQGVLEKLTAPANRVGTLLDQPDKGVARIMVGGAEYYANVDPRLAEEGLKVGHQILVNEAYVVIRSLGYDRNGPIVKVREILGDGRLRIDQEAGRQGILIHRAGDLAGQELKVGDEVRLDPSHRIAIERLENPQGQAHLLAELPTVRWEHIGGQQEAIQAIRRSIEYPLLHGELFSRYQFQQPKGFLLYGPPGCGKTLIGQATAASLGQLFAKEGETLTPHGGTQEQGSSSQLPPIEGGVFLHVKGPEVLNMWVGESERIIRDLFLQARQQRQAGKLPFIFIDEAESILGTRRAVRSYNVSNTLVPMFCAELDGIESLSQVVVILASNRPDMIDPAVLRPGRIDRKIKVGRPGRNDVAEILRVYLTADLPYYDTKKAAGSGQKDEAPVSQIIDGLLEDLFQRSQENRVLAIRLRNGRREILYRRDLLSGAVLAGIVRRAKERAIERAIQAGDQEASGLSLDDLLIASNEEFKESEIFPPDDSAEEWLKLLDYHPDQVVGVSSLRPGKAEEEHRTSQIV